MVKNANQQQTALLVKKFFGHVKPMSYHKFGSKVLENLYEIKATKQQARELFSEFFGQEYVVFKDQELKLEKILSDQPQKLKGIIGSMEEYLVTVFGLNNPSILESSILHKVLYLFMLHADVKSRGVIIDLSKSDIVRFLHTKEGSKAAVLCVKYSNAKQRKEIIKVCKEYVKKICMEEYGFKVILELLASVDDTTLLSKGVLSVISNNLVELCFDPFGYLCVLATLMIPTQKYYPEPLVKLLGPVEIINPDDLTKVMTSKKSSLARQNAITAYMLKSITQTCISHVSRFATHNYAAVILYEAFKLSDDSSKEQILESLLSKIGKGSEEEGDGEEVDGETKPHEPEKEYDLLCHSIGQILLKKFIKLVPDLAFHTKIWDVMEPSALRYASHPFAAWIVLALLETESVGLRVSASLKGIKPQLLDAQASMEKEKRSNLHNTPPKSRDTSKKRSALEIILEKI
eukprot:TRINITY_DN5359_c0_g1_i1.p1 TRINITY_DN5359_c0_g1~~TRINITY_DN5359_c0_g1_i1.p1  ORF type:complete len:461 (+),score=112.92 TRINITY_DN5359_c0_g1_i1:143-1525(+)